MPNPTTDREHLPGLFQHPAKGFSGSPTVLIDGENVSGAPEISEPACASRLPSLAEVKDWIR